MALIQDRNGVYLKEEAISTISTQFSAELQDEYFDIEDNSWWFQYKYRVLRYFADKFFLKDKRIYDIGGGNGYIAGRFVADGYNMGLIEPAYEACLNAKKRGVSYLVNGSIGDVDFGIQQCTCLDVLEHVEDDKLFLTTIYEKLEVGGIIILTVPAFMSLWSSEDVRLGHFRRYRRKQLCTLFESVGFDVRYSNYYFSFLYIPIFIVRVMMEKLGISKRLEERSRENNANREAYQHRMRSGFVNKVLGWFMDIDLAMLKKNCGIPFGSSVIAVAKKNHEK